MVATLPLVLGERLAVDRHGGGAEHDAAVDEVGVEQVHRRASR